MARLSDIERRIEEESGLHVRVDDRDGTVVLSGLVASAEERRAVEDLARMVFPRRDVVNDLEVESFGIGGEGTPLEDAVDHTETP